MIKAKAFLMLAMAVVLGSCTMQTPSPMELDPSHGVFTFITEDHAPWSAGIVVNGVNILQDAFIFNEKERLAVIASLGELDVRAAFSGDSARGTVRLTLYNAGKNRMDVNQVKISPTMVTQELGETICLQAESSWPWTFIIDLQGDQPDCSLDLSGSSIVLLPEEKISLPGLEFFYHLCPE